MGEIKIVKLQSGEELIGIIEIPTEDGTESDEDLSLEHLVFLRGPMRIEYRYDDKARPHLFLFDWMPAAADDLYPIQKHQVITIVDASPSVENLYAEVRTNAIQSLLKSSEPTTEEEEAQEETLKKLLDELDFDDEDKQ